MTTKIGLPENRAKLKGAGIIKEKDKSFTEGYNAGFAAGMQYGKYLVEKELEGE